MVLALVTAHDAPQHLAPREVPEPSPAPDEAVVDVHAVSVNQGELRLLAARPDGWRPGQDVAGVVRHEAADGSGPPPGTPVVAWVDDGGWAQRLAVPTTGLVALPDTVDLAAAATLPVAGVTALRVLRRGGLLTGRAVLVTGASGGVGRFAVELAAVSGARVTGVTSRTSRAAGLLELGAADVVHDVRDATTRFDLILESVGGASLSATPSMLARDGVLVVFGNSSREPSTLSFAALMDSPDARIEVFRVYESHDAATRRQDLARLVAFVADGRLHPRIGVEVDHHDAGAALRALAAREVEGKAVIRFRAT